MSILVEAIACSADDARIAEQSGARRLEVCSAMAVGGLTPSLGSFRMIRAATHLPLIAMIRPRPSGFCYSQSEFQAMLEDLATFVDAGADGFVFGVLDSNAKIDVARMKLLIETADGKEVVMHRAFDATPAPFEALDTLKQLGVTRVLTTGQAPSAIQGLDLLKRLVEASGTGTPIQILVGGGVRPENVKEIVTITGATQVHLGPFHPVPDRSMENNGACASTYGATYSVADGLAIARVVEAVR